MSEPLQGEVAWSVITDHVHIAVVTFFTHTHLSSQVLFIAYDTNNVHTQIGHVYACLGNERSLCLEDCHRQRLGGRCASSGPEQFSKDLFSYLVFLILHGSSSSPSCLVICNLMSHTYCLPWLLPPGTVLLVTRCPLVLLAWRDEPRWQVQPLHVSRGGCLLCQIWRSVNAWIVV